MKRPASANTRFVSQEKLFPNQYDYIGIGQIVGQNYKAACIDDRGEEKGEVGAGFAERYKIRLCHKNSPETSDDILVNALRETDFPSGQCALDVYIPLALLGPFKYATDAPLLIANLNVGLVVGFLSGLFGWFFLI